MTREEAIKELNDHYDTTDEVWLDFPRLKEALEMAISALSENKGEITTLEAENKALRIKLENAEDVLRGLKEDLADARAELRERR